MRAVILLFLAATVSCGATPEIPHQQRPKSELLEQLNMQEYATPLMRAASSGDVNEVRRLLAAGADVNAKIETLGITALTVAANAGHLDVVKLLLEARADPNAWGGMSHPRIVISVITSAMMSRKTNRLEIIDALIAAGAKVNPPDPFPQSPLQFAVEQSDMELVKALLDRGADVNWTNGVGHTALVTSLADADGPDVNIVKLLLDAGADPNKPRLWSGDECVSLLVYLDGWLKGSNDQPRRDARRLLIQHGAKKYRTRAAETGCLKTPTPEQL